MVVQSIDSAGAPVFQSLARGQQQPETSAEQDTPGDRSFAPSRPRETVTLEQRVRGQKKLEMAREDRELVNLDVLSSDLEFSPDQSSESGLKAVMITRNQSNPFDFELSLLRVEPNGSTETLFQTEDIEPLQAETSETRLPDFNFRGSLFDRSV